MGFNSGFKGLMYLLEVHGHDCWFQRLEATTHGVNLTLRILRVLFRDRIISRNGWPTRSPI